MLTIDALGRKCPIPIIMLAEQIRDIPVGSIVAVLADDPAAYTDIPSWCAMKSHEFSGYQDLPKGLGPVHPPPLLTCVAVGVGGLEPAGEPIVGFPPGVGLGGSLRADGLSVFTWRASRL